MYLFFLLFIYSLFSINFVDFDSGMSNFKNHTKQNNQDWLKIRNAYEYNINNQKYSNIPKIPKIIHHIWLGSKLPQDCAVLREQWIKTHPNWQFFLWDDTQIQQFNLVNNTAFNKAKTYGEKADIARYEILYRMGGLYIDTDFQCVQSFDELHHRFHFYIGLLHNTTVEINNALIGSVPGHPLLAKFINHIKNDTSPRKDSGMNVLERTGSYMITKYILNTDLTDPNYSVLVFPVNFFYPIPSYYKNDPQLPWIKSETMAIHLWKSSWMK